MVMHLRGRSGACRVSGGRTRAFLVWRVQGGGEKAEMLKADPPTTRLRADGNAETGREEVMGGSARAAGRDGGFAGGLSDLHGVVSDLGWFSASW